MKKLLTLLLAVTLILTLASCSFNPFSKENTVEEPETSESTPEPSDESDDKATSEPSEKPGSSKKDSDSEIRGGTNQDDAVLLPMNTNIYGVVEYGGNSWLAFTTGDDKDATYNVTTINKTARNSDLIVYVCDEFGKELDSKRATSDGVAVTSSFDKLSPNTTYYVRVTRYTGNADEIHYRITIKNPDEELSAVKTSGNIAEARGASGALEDNVVPGTNQDDAAYLSLNAKISGTISIGKKDQNGNVYIAFTTGSNKEAEYAVTTIDKSTEGDLIVYVYDEYGKELDSKRATSDGVAVTSSFDKLTPNTTYYVRITRYTGNADEMDYTVSVQSSEPENDLSAASIETLEEQDLVFETPFELTETQVMFVAEKAAFVDENAAKTALKPVADVILAHPDHKILLAGTTATDGSQAARVELSNKRAEAVKKLLVNSYGVPDTQLLTIGLGFEADPFVRGNDRDANGKFVETEGAKNRRVVVLDANDPIAQRLLNQ